MFNKPSWSSDGKCQYATTVGLVLNYLCISIVCVLCHGLSVLCWTVINHQKIDIHSTDTRNRQCIEYQYITIEYHSGRLSKKLVYTISQV